ncbi:MAG TPA: MFS transporter [Gemmatimonadales bacterium]|nr:MFS transporter [Gemmatimonadales bacterium]
MTERRPPVFYGWWIVCGSAIGLFLSGVPITVYSFGVFLTPLREEFHAGRAAISLAFTLHSIVAACCAPLVGRLADRYGARPVTVGSILLLGVLLLSALTLGTHLSQLYLFYALLGLLGIATGPITYSILISRWFDRRRGLALGLMMFGLGLGAIVMPPLVQRLITTLGWRAAFAAVGGAALAIALPVAAGVLVEQPRRKGLLPDGARAPAGADGVPARDPGLEWRETWRCGEFWLMVAAFSVVSASTQATVLHMPALLRDRGMTADAAALASSVVGIALLAGRTGSGYLLDRLFAPYVSAIIFCLAAAGMALLAAGATGQTALAAGFMAGLALGAEVDIIAFLMSRYFGLRALGTAFGLAFGSFVLAGGLGVFLMGAGFDRTGSYRAPLVGYFAVTLAAALLMTRLGPYRYAAPQAKPLHRPLTPEEA